MANFSHFSNLIDYIASIQVACATCIEEFATNNYNGLTKCSLIYGLKKHVPAVAVIHVGQLKINFWGKKSCNFHSILIILYSVTLNFFQDLFDI